MTPQTKKYSRLQEFLKLLNSYYSQEKKNYIDEVCWSSGLVDLVLVPLS